MSDDSESMVLHQSVPGLAALALALQQRDLLTYQHCLRTAKLVAGFARDLGVDGDDRRCLCQAGFMHDLGKIGVPDRVLYKDGRLNAEEWTLMRAHSSHSTALLQCLRLPRGALMGQWVDCHHERHDGKGYPHGLAGSDIPWGARVISLADTYDAITNGRPYRAAEDHAHALRIIENEAGIYFDPDLTRLFLRFMRH